MQRLLRQLKEKAYSGADLTHYEYLEKKTPVYGNLKYPLPSQLEQVLKKLGILKLYSHQATALDILETGKNLVVSTPTASGKSLIYHLHSLRILTKYPDSHILYLFPVKALAQDQLSSLREILSYYPSDEPLRVGIFDGDTKQSERKKLKNNPPEILISNPDMLHLSFLAYNHQWQSFLKTLRLVVVDEIHTYRGIFGSHVAQVLRRLRRIASYHGTEPQFVFLSATIANARDLAEVLSGQEFEAVEECGAPRAPQHFFFINPTETTSTTLAANLMVRAMERGLKTIVFTQSRHITEVIHLRILRSYPKYGNLVSAYRAGYLPEERRYIEKQLMSGSIRGVISTSALEMGIDIGGLDVCILVGYPGTVINTWQRSGRVGRGGQESAIILIAKPDALDQYIIHHPEDFFGKPYEAAIVDPYNPEIFRGHLPCAAAELPLRSEEPAYDRKRYVEMREQLAREGKLLPGAYTEEWYSPKKYPQRHVDIRGIGEAYNIVMNHDSGDKRKRKWISIGKTDGFRAFKECHPGAVYLHRGKQYIVKSLDIKRKNVEVERAPVNYFTKVLSEKETEILDVLLSKPVRNFVVRLGKLKVTETITAYEKRLLRGQELMGVYPLELPPYEFETVGLWIEIDKVIQKRVEKSGLHFMGGIHAIEHAAISMFPLFALCDRNDIGGIAYPFHPQVEKSAVFIYDGYAGGVGLAARGYEIIEDLLAKTFDLIDCCSCEIGCPSCIHSPKCGAGNKPLDKDAAIQCLRLLLGEEGLSDDSMVSQNEKAKAEFAGEDRKEVTRENKKIAYFDIETQRLAQEVGGWENKHLMRLSVGVIYDSARDEYLVFYEDQVDELIRKLQEYDLVVGFNVKSFDYAVLQPYTASSLKTIPTFDMLEYIYKKFGFRVSLDNLARYTLEDSKLADGIMAVKWFRNGEMEKVVEYCKKDVDITRRIFEFGQENGYLIAKRKNSDVVQKLVVEWNNDSIFPVIEKDW